VSQELSEYPRQINPHQNISRNYRGTMMDDTVAILTAKALVPAFPIIPQ
jgi:hypothetical protein